MLQDNFFGNILAIHTYFLLLPLGLIAKPFGAPGLLFVARRVGRRGLLLGNTYPASSRRCWARRSNRGRGASCLTAFGLRSIKKRFYGFHVELLTPALCLILFYFLLQRRMIPSIVTALAVISVKEDAPIAAAMVAIVAGVETWISSADKH